MATWVIGDVHGCYDEFMALLKSPEIKEEDTVILIGDIIDRGPAPYKMLKWAMDNITPDGKYQMIMGNHEHGAVQDFEETVIISRSQLMQLEDVNICSLRCHYGFDVDLRDAGYESVKSAEPIFDWLAELPFYKKVTVTKPDGTLQKYVIAHAWYDESENSYTLLWQRDIELDPCMQVCTENGWYPDYEGEDNEILIHGHTIVCKENGYPEDAMVHFREHSINIDCGAFLKRIGGRLAAIRLEDLAFIYHDEPDICHYREASAPTET